jgi:hypothetical protein
MVIIERSLFLTGKLLPSLLHHVLREGTVPYRNLSRVGKMYFVRLQSSSSRMVPALPSTLKAGKNDSCKKVQCRLAFEETHGKGPPL